ncbi:MAG: hypothetical protein OXF02_06375 [Simkaniaceae bacterium]|nr:hypothetical protein [Simkaniaceae bacterium]
MEAPVDDTKTEENQVEATSPVVSSEDSDKEYNFAQMRKAQQRLEKELAESRERQQALEQKMSEEAGPEDNDLIDGAQYKQVLNRLNEVEARFQQHQVETDSALLVQKYPDFNRVVSERNLKKLEETRPALFNMVRKAGGTSRETGEAVYEAIRDAGLIPKEEATNNRRVESNLDKPQPSQTIDPAGPLESAAEYSEVLTDEMAKKLYAEAVKYAS